MRTALYIFVALIAGSVAGWHVHAATKAVRPSNAFQFYDYLDTSGVEFFHGCQRHLERRSVGKRCQCCEHHLSGRNEGLRCIYG